MTLTFWIYALILLESKSEYKINFETLYLWKMPLFYLLILVIHLGIEMQFENYFILKFEGFISLPI